MRRTLFERDRLDALRDPSLGLALGGKAVADHLGEAADGTEAVPYVRG